MSKSRSLAEELFRPHDITASPAELALNPHNTDTSFHFAKLHYNGNSVWKVDELLLFREEQNKQLRREGEAHFLWRALWGFF